MPPQDVIRTVTVRGQSQGLDRVANDLHAVADAHSAVGNTAVALDAATSAQGRATTAGTALAAVTDTVVKRQISMGSAFDRLRASLDPVAKAEQAFERGLATADRALRQGTASTEEHAAVLDQLRARLEAARTANDNYNRSLATPATASQAVRTRIEQVTGAGAVAGTRDRAGDIAAYGAQMDAVRAKYSPLFAAQREYLDQLAEIRQAHRTGALTQVETAAALQRTKDSFARNVVDLRAKGDGRLTSHQAQNLFYQGTDIATSLQGGMSPMTVLMQQGGQIAPIFAGPGSASVKGALSQAGEAAVGLVQRIGLVGGGIGLLTAAAVTGVAALVSYRSEQREVEKAMGGVGRASGVTLAQVNALAEAQARAGGMSRNTARELAATYVGTGRLDAGLVAGAVGGTRDFAGFLGVDAQEGATVLAGALGDASKGATELTERYGLLNDATAESIRRLDAQGDRLGAARKLMDAVRESTRGMAQETGGWTRLSTIAANVWDGIGSSVDRALGGNGGGADERIRGVLQDRLRQQQSSFMRAASSRGGDLEDSNAAIAETKRELDAVEARIARAKGLSQEINDNRLTAEIGSIVRGLSPAEEALKRIEDSAQKIRSGLSKLPLDEQRAAQNALDGLVRSSETLRENLKAGGDQLAASLRQAQFDSRTFGFTEQNRGAARIEFEFSERARQALTTGTASSQNAELQTLELERVTRLQSLEQQNRLDLTRAGGAFSRMSPSLQDQILGAARGAVSADIIAAIGGHESSSNPNVGYSKILGENGKPSSAYGLGQITRGTAEEAVRLGYLPQGYDRTNVATMAAGIAGVLQMKVDQNGGDLDRGIMAYRGSNDPSVNRAYLADVRRRAGQMGDLSEGTLAREQDGRTRQLQLERDELRLVTEAGGRDSEAVRARIEALRLVSSEQGRGIDVSKALVAQYSQEASERQRIVTAGRYLQFADNDGFARAQLGRDRIDQQAYAAARPFAGTQYEAMVRDRTRETMELAETKSLFLDGATSFVTELRRTGDAASALSNAFGNAADRLIAKFMDSAISSVFSAVTSGGGGSGGIGGFFSSLFSAGTGGGASPTGGVRLFDGGGYTGAGGRLEPAGIVHRGEVVWSQADVARFGGPAVVERMRRGLSGYDDGGVVGGSIWTPRQSRSAAAGPSGESSVGPPIIVNATGQPAQTERVQGPRGPSDVIVIGKMMADALRSNPDVRQALAKAYGVKRVGG